MSGIFQRLKQRLFPTKQVPVDWFAEKRSVHLYYRTTDRNQMASAIMAIPEVNEPVVFVEYPERLALEIMVSGGDDQRIADAIFNHKPYGILTLGNTPMTVPFMNVPHRIVFTKLDWLGDYQC